MSLFFAELRKVWGGRVFPALLAILAAANLLLLWMGTRPTAKQPPASAYRAVGAELSDKTMEEKGTYLHDKYTEIESLVKIGQYYREQAYGGYGLTQYRQDNAAMFDAYEQEYTDKTYTLFTDNLNTEYRLFSQLQSEYDTVAAYSDFLDSVQTKASQLSGISIFQNDRTGYDLKNIELTAQVYAGLTETPIDYYPQKGLYTAISYAFTDLILLASMLLLVEMIEAVETLLGSIEYKELVEKYVGRRSLLRLAIALREQYIQEKTDSLHKEYVNSLITSVKKELSVRSSTTAVPDIDLYQILMNQHKVQVFHDVVKMIKKPRVIQAQNLYSYRVVAQSSPFSGALAMQKVSRSKTVFSDAFKEYNDPYKFLQVLKGKDIPASEYYKYFVNITYEVFNQYGSPASGGERSEYNLLQELSDGVKNSILILDEPESSFDNIFLRDGVDSLLKDISKTIPVIIATHNNTIGVSVHPDYIVYACKEVLSDGKLEYHLYSGYPSSEDLVDLKGNHISRKSVLLDCLEAGEAAYMDRRNSYEILNG